MNNPFSPLSQINSSHWRPLAKVFLSLLIALTIYYLSLPNFEAPWILGSAFAFSVLNYGEGLSIRLLAIATCVALTLMAVFLSLIFSYQPLIWALYLFLVTFVCMYFGNKYPRFFTGSLIIILFAIISGGMETDLEYSFYRGLFIFCGAIIACITETLFWPRFVVRRRLELARTLQALKKLNALHFSCLLQTDYPETPEIYESKIYNLKYKLFFKSNPLVAMSEVIIDIGRIRYQISDHTTFNVCARELEELLRTMNRLFDVLPNTSSKESVEHYATAITSFEDLCQGVLVQVAKEPLLFELFIYKLKLFRKECERLCE